MATNYTRRVATAVRTVTADHGITQNDLMAALNLSQSAVSRRLCGQTAFSVSDLATISALLGVPTADLLAA